MKKAEEAEEGGGSEPLAAGLLADLLCAVVGADFDFAEPAQNALLWLLIEDGIRLASHGAAAPAMLRVLLDLHKHLQLSSTKVPLLEALELPGAPSGGRVLVACSTVVGSAGYVAANGASTSAVSPKTFMTHVQVLIALLYSRDPAPGAPQLLLPMLKNVWDCCIMFDRAKGAIYPMRPAKRVAVLAALRRILHRALLRVAEDMACWTYLLSAFFTVANSQGKVGENGKVAIGPVSALKTLRFSVELPLTESVALYSLVRAEGSAELEDALETVSDLLPHLIKSVHDLDSYADSELAAIVVSVTEFCAYVGPHKNLLHALERTGAADLLSSAQSAQLQQLKVLAPKFEAVLDVVYGGLLFIIKWLSERLYLWAAEASGLTFNTVEKLPVTTASFYMVPVSLNALKTSGVKPSQPLTQQQRRVIALRIFREEGCRDLSVCLYQVLILSLNLSVSTISETVRQELGSLLQLVAEGAHLGLGGGCPNMRFKSSANSVVPNIHFVTDSELFQAVNSFQKYLISHAGLLLAIEQRFSLWKTLRDSFRLGDGIPEPVTHTEFFMTPVALSKRFWWFARGLLPSLELAAEETRGTATGSDPLIGVERALWDLFIHALKVGPVLPPRLISSPGAPLVEELRRAAFDAHDVYLAFYGFMETFLKHVNKHVTNHNEIVAAKPESAKQGFYAAATNLHGLVCLQQNGWIDLFVKWSKAGQYIASQQSASGTWTDCELGLKIRESAVYLYHLFKGLKLAMPEDAKSMLLGKDVLVVMQGGMIGATPGGGTGPVNEASLSAQSSSGSQVGSKKKYFDSLKESTKEPLNFDQQPTLLSTATSGSKRPRDTRDIAKEMMSQWKDRGGPNARQGETITSGLKVNDEATLAKEPMWRRNVLTGKANSGPLPEAAAGTCSREMIIVGPGGKPLPRPESAPAKPEGPPQLKKISQEDRKKLAVDAKAGLQKVLMEILDWDMFNLENYQPPELQDFPSKLPTSFPTKECFQKYFGPLVLEECRCSMLQERIERRLEAFPVIITSASLSAGWMLVGARSARLRAPRDGSARPTVTEESTIENASPYDLEMLPFRKHDLLLLINCEDLRTAVSPFEGRTVKELLEENGGGPPRYPYFLGVVEKREDDVGGAASASAGGIPSTLRDQVQCFLRLPRKAVTGSALRIPSSNVAIGSKWIAYSIACLTTSVREFQSLFMSAFSSVFDFLINPGAYLDYSRRGPRARGPERQLSTIKKPAPSFLESLRGKANLNASQTLAVKHALSADYGVALLQGPPGTGKTKTLLSILSAIFLQRALEANSGRKTGETIGARKILVCAPSNAAVDEIACRVLREGLVGQHGQTFRPKCFRVGNPNRITRDSVREISLEVLLSRENSELKTEKKEQMEKNIEKIGEEMNKIERQLLLVQTEAGVDGPGYGELKAQQRALYAQRKKLRENLSDDVKGAQKSNRESVIKSADIIFATLSGSASELLNGIVGSGSSSSAGAFFEYVVIDEAAQAVELSTLIPLRHDVEKLVLIGDPQQLPATVLSSSAKKFNYERSLFQRLESCGVEVVMLNVQYRMRVEISAFPAKHFYKSQLVDDPVAVCQRPLAPWSAGFPSLLGPLKFFHLPSREDRGHTQSLYNTSEATFIVELILFLLRRFGRRLGTPRGVSLRDVAVLTPYRQQVLEIQRVLRTKASLLNQFEAGEAEGPTAPGAHGGVPDTPVEVCTIDSFQGREKPIILFSCVRSLATGLEADLGAATPAAPVEPEDEFGAFFGRPQKRARAPQAHVNIGFVADIRRLNVAITRARESLWIVGNAATLANHQTWQALVAHAKNSSAGAQISAGGAPLVERLRQASFVDVPGTCQMLRGGGGAAGGVTEFFSLCDTRLSS